MTDHLKGAADGILDGMTSGNPGVPGVVAIATDRTGNIYEGASGSRELGQDGAMIPVAAILAPDFGMPTQQIGQFNNNDITTDISFNAPGLRQQLRQHHEPACQQLPTLAPTVTRTPAAGG